MIDDDDDWVVAVAIISKRDGEGQGRITKKRFAVLVVDNDPEPLDRFWLQNQWFRGDAVCGLIGTSSYVTTATEYRNNCFWTR